MRRSLRGRADRCAGRVGCSRAARRQRLCRSALRATRAGAATPPRFADTAVGGRIRLGSIVGRRRRRGDQRTRLPDAEAASCASSTATAADSGASIRSMRRRRSACGPIAHPRELAIQPVIPPLGGKAQPADEQLHDVLRLRPARLVLRRACPLPRDISRASPAQQSSSPPRCVLPHGGIARQRPQPPDGVLVAQARSPVRSAASSACPPARAAAAAAGPSSRDGRWWWRRCSPCRRATGCERCSAASRFRRIQLERGPTGGGTSISSAVAR